MKIKEMKVLRNPVLGSLEDNFEVNGEISDTIVFAGDNGCGKTTILEMIYELGCGHQPSLDSSEERKFTIQMNADDKNAFNGSGQPGYKIPEDLEEIDLNFRAANGIHFCTFQYRVDGTEKSQIHNVTSEPYRNFIKALYSPAQIGFVSGNIKATTSLVLNNKERFKNKPQQNFATEIHQLLIDLHGQDASDALAIFKANVGSVIAEDKVEIRIKRFSKAFNSIASHIQAKGVESKGNQKEFVFTSFGKEVPINSLSSGEKQIVFRGTHLLRDVDLISNGFVCIDEPEISLHPNWQSKALGFYKSLFTDGGTQKVQLFVNTHSPELIHGTVEEKVIVLRRDANNKIELVDKPTYPSMGDKSLINQAFNYPQAIRDTVKNNIVFVEGSTDKIILEAAWDKLNPGKEMPFEIINGFNCVNIRVMLSRDETFLNSSDKHFVGLFDFDGAYNDWNGLKKANWAQIQNKLQLGLTKKHKDYNGYALLLPVPESRTNYANESLKAKSILSIEFLFEDAHIDNSFLLEEDIAGTEMKRKTFNDDKKTEFARSVFKLEPEDFKNFQPLLDQITNLFTVVL